MIDLTGITHHSAIEEIVEVLCNKTQNTDRGFFRAEVAYFLGKMASSMRALIVTKDRGEIPVNIYALCLATSGYGKGHSVGLLENEFMKPFKKRFMEETLPIIADKHLWDIANERCVRNGSNDPQEEYEKVAGEFKRAGSFPFTFDSGTPPAVKQLRQKLLLANVGSINLQIDEIGSNLVGSIDLLTLFLELYDQGMVKQKLTKNTAENQRSEEVDGKTPANMLLFGTQSKLFDGGQTEDQFYSMLDIGYARRCIFGWGQQDQKAFHTQSAKEIYNRLTQPTNNVAVNKWSDTFYKLADPAMYGWKVMVEEDVGIKLIEYKIACEQAATLLPDHDEIRKAEMSHRYFKALKLAGAYAFVDGSEEITMEHFMSAVLLVEESGTSFQRILNREKTYVKLAKYVATVGTEVTHADLNEALPFYKSGQAARNEMMTLATAWGYPRHILIKKSFVDGIEFFKGETLQESDLTKIKVSYSDHYAYNYLNEEVPFEHLHRLTQAQGMHWANHHFKGGHRAEEKALAGFNLIAIDVDGDTTLATAHELLKEWKFMTYTTKRHTDEKNRFRLILPTNYYLQLDTDEYKEFMNSVMEWLPFKTDESANQRAKKWESNNGEYHYNMEGELLDVLPFIPKTSKHETHKQSMQKIQSMDNMERWFAQRIASGNRNNQMIKYALALVDSGLDLMAVRDQVHSFNQKLSNPMDEAEINATILTTVAKKFQRN
jgi:hypothetical protein